MWKYAEVVEGVEVVEVTFLDYLDHLDILDYLCRFTLSNTSASIFPPLITTTTGSTA